MKLAGIMSLSENRRAVHDLIERYKVRIFSETDILGHTPHTIQKFGWFASGKKVPQYSTLYFAILPDESAEAIFAEIAEQAERDGSDHPTRAFLVPVEKMV